MTFHLPRTRLRTLAINAMLLAVPFFTGSHGALAAPKLDVIYTFPCGGGDCGQGASPRFTFISDSAGNLYGTTLFGGAHANGSAFEMVKTAHGYKFEKLYDFCAQANCTDGGQSASSLIMDVKGNLYGTTVSGGANGGGNIFKLSPAKHHKPWTIKTLYDFCSESCANAIEPIGGLTYQGQQTGQLYDGTSSLFGASWAGGTGGQGTAYRLDFPGGKGAPVESVIYSFCQLSNCKDGAHPVGAPAIDAAGNLYGSTSDGGINLGVVYELTLANNKFSETVLGKFCADPFPCVQQPQGRLSMDAQGHLYGASTFGSGQDEGALFEIVPSGVISTGTILYTFCSDLGVCEKGGSPNGDLLIAADGTIYGTTFQGGEGHSGTVFKFSNGALKVLYSFCVDGVGVCTDGYMPLSGVIFDQSGKNILGSTSGGLGGPTHGGTMFEAKAGKK